MTRLSPMLLLLLAAPAHAADPEPKRAVEVRTGATDALTGRLADAVRAALPAAEQVRAPAADEDDLALVLSNVAADGKKVGWSADLLKINPGFTPSRVGSFAGRCRGDDLAGCAKDVLAQADRAVRKAAKD